MNFEPFGPFEIPRLNRIVPSDVASKRSFWEQVEDCHPGLSTACGCYVFQMRAGRGVLPWYVGMAEKQSFYKECFAPTKINHYNMALAKRKGGTPQLLLVAQVTPNGRLKKPSGKPRPAIPYLENMMIGLSLAKNENLCNIKNTKKKKELVVKGVLNDRSARSGPSKDLRNVLGI